MHVMRRYINVLVERRMAPLYHVLDSAKAFNVFEQDLMPARWEHDIPGLGQMTGNSFTRNQRLAFDKPVRITVDQAKLAQRHRIVPLDAEYVHRNTYAKSPEYSQGMHAAYRDRRMNRQGGTQFAEEFVIGDIKGLHRYLTAVEVIDLADTPQETIDLIEMAKAYAERFRVPFSVEPKVTKRVEEYLSYREYDDE